MWAERLNSRTTPPTIGDVNPWWIALSSPIVAAVAAFVVTRRARRRAHAAAAEAARERTVATLARDRQALDAELARGFDLIDTETAVVELVANAVSRVGWVGPVELHLVARDAPRLELALSTARPPRPVEPRDWSPWECVAARTGTTVRSADTSRLDACPHLRSRLDAPHAVSVPLLVRGRILGVLHAVSAAIYRGYLQNRGGNINGVYPGLKQVMSQDNSHRTAAGTYVSNQIGAIFIG